MHRYLLVLLLISACASKPKEPTDEIRRVLLENVPSFRNCYLVAVPKKDITYSGIVKLRFVINASGKVESPKVEVTETLPPNFISCLTDVLAKLEFPKPANGGTIEVGQPMNFYPKEP